MKSNYKLWIFQVNFIIQPLIQLQKNIYLPLYIQPSKILYLPIHISPKLLNPSLHSIYKIVLDDELNYIEAKNLEHLYVRVGLSIRFYLLDLLDELFQIVLPLSNNFLNIIIYISFSTREFENGTHKICLQKKEDQHLNEIIQSLLNKLYKLDEKYNILYIHTIKIKIIYGK
jgi:hypothetical protein